MIDFSLIIACYKDAPHLMRNVMALARFLDHTAFSYEFIFIEDASQDETATEVRRCVGALEKAGVATKAIFHTQNVGRGGSVSEGILASSGRIVGYIDIDLEHLMDGILPMLLAISYNSYDVMVGSRIVANPWAKPLRVLSSFTYRMLISSFIALPICDTEAGLKLFRRETILPVLARTKDKAWFWDTEIIHRAHLAGLKVGEHRILFVEDRSKKSTVRLIPDTFGYLVALMRHLQRIKAEEKQVSTNSYPSFSEI